MSPLRVAAAQAVSVPGDVPANVATAVALVTEAADRGARVVVLPELFLTGYAPETWTHEGSLALDPSTGSGRREPALAPLSEVCTARGVVLVVGAAVRRTLDPSTGSRRRASTLSALVVAPGQEVQTVYDKQHLSGPEREFFTAGTRGASVVVDGWELGLGICYDSSFPEHAVAAARDGASAYLCPAASFTGSEHRHDLKFAARAMDAGLYVVVAGLTGSCGETGFLGRSAVHDPEGRTVARLGEEPGVVVHDLDPQLVATYRGEHPTESERLPSLGARSRLVLTAS